MFWADLRDKKRREEKAKRNGVLKRFDAEVTEAVEKIQRGYEAAQRLLELATKEAV